MVLKGEQSDHQHAIQLPEGWKNERAATIVAALFFCAGQITASQAGGSLYNMYIEKIVEGV